MYRFTSFRPCFLLVGLIASLVSTGVVVRADELDEAVSTRAPLEARATWVSVDGIRLTIHAANPAIIPCFLEVLGDGRGQGMNDVRQKLDQRRVELFPKESILVLLVDQKVERAFADSAAPGKKNKRRIDNIGQIIWWFTEVCEGCSWSVGFNAHAADFFVYGNSGEFEIFEMTNGSYYLLFHNVGGILATSSQWGRLMSRGYRAVGLGSYNVATFMANFYVAY